MNTKLTRRDFLRLSALAAAGAAVAACTPKPVETPEPTVKVEETKAAPTEEAGPSKKQSPIFQDMVKAGDLPALEERIPADPLVVKPYEKVGTFGGTWRSGSTGRADGAWQSRTMAWEDLLRWKTDLTEIIPNVASSWDVTDDGKEWTFYLRKGMKWSDGHPFTAADFVWWYENAVLDDDLSPSKPSWMKPGGELGKVEKIDDTTVKFTFMAANGLFLFSLANTQPFLPGHYLEQFHIKFNKEEVEKGVTEGSYDDWVGYYGAKNDYRDNVNRPVIYGWSITVPVGSATQIKAERNPYYWKVDTEGNQLPYIDVLDFPIVESADILLMKALNGEIDMMARHFTSSQNKPVLFDGQEKGGYHFVTINSTGENTMNLCFNLAHKDPGLREVFQKKEFRIAMSHAINRQDIIDTVYVGQGTPRQSGPIEASKFYNEQLATQYLEYDVAKANQILDDLGLEKGPDGMRKRFDGEPLYFNIDCMVNAADHGQVMEMVSKMWKEVGVDSAVKNIERALFYERKEASEHDMVPFWVGDGMVVLVDPRSYMPFSHESPFANAWVTWRDTNGAEGEEPLPAAKRQIELYQQIQATAGEVEKENLMKEIIQIAADEFWVIGMCTPTPGYGLVKNNFKNMPESYFSWWPARDPANTNPEQYYIEPE
jgi:peptide/nickel transport system substrate-binding protein